MKYHFSEIKFQVWEWFYDKYIFVKDIFFPWNRLKIRNLSRRYCDKDTMLVHSTFTILCNLVEREYGSYEKFDNYIKELYKDNNYSKSKWIEALESLREAYIWYTTVNWKNPVPMSEEYKNANFDWKDMGDGLFEFVPTKDFHRLAREHTQLEDDFQAVATEHMMNIVKYRGFMWT